VAPGLVSTAIDSFNAHLIMGSPTINAGTSSGAPLDDFDGRLRDALPDIGAYEWRPPAAWVYLPVIRSRTRDGFFSFPIPDERGSTMNV